MAVEWKAYIIAGGIPRITCRVFNLLSHHITTRGLLISAIVLVKCESCSCVWSY
jgi:hypothetical protein